MSIRDVSINGQHGFQNAIGGEIQQLVKNRAFAIKQGQKTGNNMSQLIAHYDARLAKFRNMYYSKN